MESMIGQTLGQYQKDITDPIPLPHMVNPNIPDSVERVLLKALAKNPNDRFRRAGEMAEALRRAVTDLSPAVAGRPIPPDPDATVGLVCFSECKIHTRLIKNELSSYDDGRSFTRPGRHASRSGAPSRPAWTG